ncbi:hypothetical protein KQX54_017158 [Cotesia glomerata]|uniref:Uncharacterized protein n=1 Tax=Cotesia glomerata TaxID=32391 RepID=A0AAV7IXT4_COTGL|nr:hypothetical protein KQX54_017158 [Cotesia glomerata]
MLGKNHCTERESIRGKRLLDKVFPDPGEYVRTLATLDYLDSESSHQSPLTLSTLFLISFWLANKVG